MNIRNTSVFAEEDPMLNFMCNDEIVLLNTTLVGFNCFALIEREVKVSKCAGACLSIGARRPYYNEFLTMNITQLKVMFVLFI